MHSCKKRKLTDAPLGGTCTDTPYGVRYVDGMTDSVETLSASKKCTCDSGGVKVKRWFYKWKKCGEKMV